MVPTPPVHGVAQGAVEGWAGAWWDSPEGDVVEADVSEQGVGRDGDPALQWHGWLQLQELKDTGASAQTPHHLWGNSRSTSWTPRPPDPTSLVLRPHTTCKEGGKSTPGAANLNPQPQGVPGPPTPPTWPIRMEMLAKDLGGTRAEVELRAVPRQAAGYRGCQGYWGYHWALP